MSANEWNSPSRRDFVGLAAAAAAGSITSTLFGQETAQTQYETCAFIKFLQKLNYAQLAEAIAQAGFDGVEVTVREKEGYIHPAVASEELPKLLESLEKHGLKLTILTTDILAVEQTYAKDLLTTAASLKVPRYRMGFYRYDLKQPILKQLPGMRSKVRDLAALNRDLGIGGIYQNHCGADFFGATMWDLHSVIKDYSAAEMGCVFDIRHASVEAGEAWPQMLNLMQPHIAAVSVKDYVWNGSKSQHVALGKGRVDPGFFKMLKAGGFAGPISVHVEYLPRGGATENVEALRTDLGTLRKMLAA